MPSGRAALFLHLPVDVAPLIAAHSFSRDALADRVCLPRITPLTAGVTPPCAASHPRGAALRGGKIRVSPEARPQRGVANNSCGNPRRALGKYAPATTLSCECSLTIRPSRQTRRPNSGSLARDERRCQLRVQGQTLCRRRCNRLFVSRTAPATILHQSQHQNSARTPRAR